MTLHKPIPPALAQKILLHFLRDDLAENVIGDLNENFYSALKTKSLWKAKLGYWYQVINYLRPVRYSKIKTYAAEQRTKEIGVRKVLGASVTSIVNLLSRDFLKLVCLAILIASPIAWWSMNQWLQDFAYRIKIEWWIFLLSGLFAVAIALLTVSFQSIKAALTNPVKSLRSE